jgi:hypothetical protein
MMFSESWPWAAPFEWRILLPLLRRLVLVGLVTLLLVLLARLLILLGSLAGRGGIRGLVRLRSSNIDPGHRMIFRISTRKYFSADL